ncbi:hypothetical protein Y900_003230 [Mycolicibacterium aromaticivorans JS19b1 = JCM 16368]|uniref:DUF5642 domain-containing protein n=1 Tax=Mycolicibacterium aromaticivorans JS19b1 = JCM 16368 TaxID=1440774 RepID=A0A064CGS0_9MYCO|nr:hypothetical protein [Mycolicibacterium aromaticivorans]KDE97977.1 hypothetical protein Y900_003230 [Mycolicibacterium aromaticivorans JS19b1 = JCM 16368]
MSGRAVLVTASVAAVLVAGCGSAVSGTATWPGATLEKATLAPADFPPGVQYDRIVEQLGQPDNTGSPPSMRSRPEGCANALTNVIAGSAERGPGSAAKYAATYNGTRIVMTVLSWPLDLNKLEAAAVRCAQFETYFDTRSKGIPITTTELPGLSEDALAYQQTMQLMGSASSVYMAFQNVGRYGVFGIAFPTSDPSIAAKASLPQTFLDVFAKQAVKIRNTI